jgi:hypothetical protein
LYQGFLRASFLDSLASQHDKQQQHLPKSVFHVANEPIRFFTHR